MTNAPHHNVPENPHHFTRAPLTAVASLALAALVGGAARAQIVVDGLGDRIAVYHKDVAAKNAAHPSYALAAPPTPDRLSPAPGGMKVSPVFGETAGKPSVRITIDPATSLYGTGEVTGPLLRNGRRVVCWNTDAYGYADETFSLYQSHPWVLAVRPDGTAFGVLADTTFRCTVDTAAARSDEIAFIAGGPTVPATGFDQYDPAKDTTAYPAFPVIIIERDSPQEVVKALADLTGKMPMPPKWALGYHQCRYSYYPESRAREVASEFRKRSIPCDVIWYDIDYMEAFRVFTFDRGYFPDPKKLNDDLLAEGFHNVWMIDPGMKSRETPGPADRKPEDLAKEPKDVHDARAKELAKYKAIHESGAVADVWVKKADGSVFEGEVWPGMCTFPDYTRPDVRRWWGALYKDFVAHGITGIWNDMNEPAVFGVPSKTMPEDNVHLGDPAMLDWTGKPQGAERAKGPHARYHNVYGMMMIKGTREGIQAANPDKRPFVLSRASFIGGQRFGPTWTGDNTADWAHLEDSIPMVLNLGLSGQAFTGPDLGGFVGNGDAQQFARWMGFGAMLPFARGHTGKGNVDKEPWAFGPEVEETCRLALARRYRFMPYLYTLFHESSTTGLPIARPLFFADPKDMALRTEDDAFLLGGDVIVAAQVTPDRARVIAMPKGDWRVFDFEIPSDIKSTTKGRDGVNADLPRLYLRPGAIVATGPVMMHVDQRPLDPITLLVNLDENGQATGSLYEDAGDGYGHEKGQYLRTTYRARREGGTVMIDVLSAEGSITRPQRDLNVRLLTASGEIAKQGSDGEPVVLPIE
jgi:alpha-glucosidase